MENKHNFIVGIMDKAMDIIDDEQVESLYKKMYEYYYDGGKEYFDDFESEEEMLEYDISHCKVVKKGEQDFEYILDHYKTNGLKYVSTFKYACIEAVDDEQNPTMFLVRK